MRDGITRSEFVYSLATLSEYIQTRIPQKDSGFFVVCLQHQHLTKVALPTIISSVELIEKEKNR